MPCSTRFGRRALYASTPLVLTGVMVMLVGCASVTPTPVSSSGSSAHAEIEGAIRFAFGLESALFERVDEIASRDDVAAHFRQGFASPLAEDFAAYFWHRDRLRTGEPTLRSPDTVTVLDASATTATAYFETPPALRETWDLPRYTLADLQREGSRWIVAATRQQETRPR